VGVKALKTAHSVGLWRFFLTRLFDHFFNPGIVFCFEPRPFFGRLFPLIGRKPRSARRFLATASAPLYQVRCFFRSCLPFLPLFLATAHDFTFDISRMVTFIKFD
jgi:hypothetical protein